MARNLKLLPELVGLLALLGTAHADTGASEVLRLANVAASRVTTCQATADDLGAEAAMRFLRTHRGVPEGDSNPAGYIRRIVDNLRRDWLRRESRVLAFSEIDAPHLELAAGTSSRGDPAEAAEVAEFVAGLEPHEREILELMIEGLGEREIALGTGNTRHGVRAMMRGIRAHASEYFDPPTS